MDLTATTLFSGSWGAPAASEYTNRLGELVPIELSLFKEAEVVKKDVTAEGDAVGFASRTSATTPATWGEAMEVPLMVFVATSLVFQADKIELPGAKMSRQDP